MAEKRKARVYLEDIHESIERIEEYTKDLTPALKLQMTVVLNELNDN